MICVYCLAAGMWTVAAAVDVAVVLDGRVPPHVALGLAALAAVGVIAAVWKLSGPVFVWSTTAWEHVPAIRAVRAAANHQPAKVPLLDRKSDSLLYLMRHRWVHGMEVRRGPVTSHLEALAELDAGAAATTVTVQIFLFAGGTATGHDWVTGVRRSGHDGFERIPEPEGFFVRYLRSAPLRRRLGVDCTTVAELRELADQIRRATRVGEEEAGDVLV
jgi:hypothetical protein